MNPSASTLSGGSISLNFSLGSRPGQVLGFRDKKMARTMGLDVGVACDLTGWLSELLILKDEVINSIKELEIINCLRN